MFTLCYYAAIMLTLNVYYAIIMLLLCGYYEAITVCWDVIILRYAGPHFLNFIVCWCYFAYKPMMMMMMIIYYTQI